VGEERHATTGENGVSGVGADDPEIGGKAEKNGVSG
jgi:hypothetical protein